MCIEQIKRLQRNGSVEHEFSIFWVPRRTLVSNQILEDEGVVGDVNVAELPLLFLPLENDVLSLELEDAFNDLYLVGFSETCFTNNLGSFCFNTDAFSTRIPVQFIFQQGH